MIGGIVWGVVTPDPKELYHMATGEPLVHSIRATINDAAEAAGGSFEKTRRFLGKFIGAADRALWWSFLIESGVSGLIEASAAIRRMAQCDKFHDPNFGSGGWYVSAINDYGDWQGIDTAISQPESKFYPVASTSISAKPHRTALVAASAQFEDFNAIPVQTQQRIIRLDTGGILDSDNNHREEATSGWATHAWYKSKSAFSQDTLISSQFQYTGPPRPLHEVFPIAETVNVYLYD